MAELNPQQTRQRLRLVFAKKAQVKYISHLDLVLAWERALRRARIPLAYSQGFNPRPKIQVVSGLPVGTTSVSEIMDIIVTRPINLEEAFEEINLALPVGIALLSINETPLKGPTLQHLLRQAGYRVVVETDLSRDELERSIESLLAADEIIQTRRRKKRDETFNMRPWVYELSLEAAASEQATLLMRLAAGQFGNLRPDAVLKALGLGDNWADIERVGLIFEDDLIV